MQPVKILEGRECTLVYLIVNLAHMSHKDSCQASKWYYLTIIDGFKSSEGHVHQDRAPSTR